MPYTIAPRNPLDFELFAFDVVVSYDNSLDRFYVTYVETNTGYMVNRGDLVGEDFKYTDSIIAHILSGCDTDVELDVFFTPTAENEVHMIWMANCDIF